MQGDNSKDQKDRFLTENNKNSTTTEGLRGRRSSTKYAGRSALELREKLREQRIDEMAPHGFTWQVEDMHAKGVLCYLDMEGIIQPPIDLPKVLICPFDDTGEILPLDENQFKAIDPTKDLQQTKKGISLLKRAIKINRPMKLRALASRIDMKFTLQGNSFMKVLLRSTNMRNEETTFVHFSKEQVEMNEDDKLVEGQKLFLLIGIIDPETESMVIVKKHEIPLYEFSEKKYLGEPLQVLTTIVDNGDGGLGIYIKLKGIEGRSVGLLFRDVMIPLFKDCNLYLYGGSRATSLMGSVADVRDDVILKMMKVDIVDREFTLQSVLAQSEANYKHLLKDHELTQSTKCNNCCNCSLI